RGQRFPVPVPGRRARRRGAAAVGDRDHGPRRGLPGRSGSGALEERCPRPPLAARAALHARDERVRARGGLRGLAPRGGARARMDRTRQEGVMMLRSIVTVALGVLGALGLLGGAAWAEAPMGGG